MPKVAVITGSNGLIGQATCRKLTQSGFLAVGVDIGAESKGNWPYYQCDLTDLGKLGQTFCGDRERSRPDPRSLQQRRRLPPGEGLARRAARAIRRHLVGQRARTVFRRRSGSRDGWSRRVRAARSSPPRRWRA